MARFATPYATIVEALRAHARAAPDRVALHYIPAATEPIVLTYGALDAAAAALAGSLRTQVRAGDRVLMFYPPGLDFVVAFFAVLYAGAIAVPLVPPRRQGAAESLAALIANAAPAAAMTVSQLALRLGDMLADLPGGISLIVTDRTQTDGCSEPVADLSPNAVGVLQYTSGSTGTPRGVMVTHDNIARNSLLMARQSELGAESMWVSWVPHFHDLGLFGSICTPLYNGFPSVLMPPAAFVTRPVLWLEAITRFGGTMSVVPNFAYDLCVRQIKDEDCAALDLASWAVAGCGAEPIRMETLNAFADRFGRYGLKRQSICQFYGLAEATLLVSGGPVGMGPTAVEVSPAGLRENRVVPPRDGSERHSIPACGRASPEHRILIVDTDAMLPCAAGTVGEIWIDGSTNAAGYWNQPTETARVFGARLATGEGPFMRTGDLGFVRDGQLYVTGRIKDVIIVGGQNIYPQDLETTALAAVAGATEAAAFALDGSGTERAAMVIEQPKPAPFDLRRLLDGVREAVWLNNGVELERVVLTRRRALPKTSSGKLQRSAARAALLDGSLPVLADWRADDQATRPDAAGIPAVGLVLDLMRQNGAEQLKSLERYLRDVVNELLGLTVDDLEGSHSLIALGVSSMGIMRVRRRVEADLMITLEASLLWQESRLSELAVVLRDQLLASPLWANADAVARVVGEIVRMSDEDVAHELASSSVA